MILLISFSSFVLLLFRRSTPVAFIPILIGLLFKAPCPSSLLSIAGDDIHYQEAIISGTGLSDPLFTLLFHHIWLETHSLKIAYIGISTLFLLVVLYIFGFIRRFYSLKILIWTLPFLAISPMILTGAIRQNFGYLIALLIISCLLLNSEKNIFISPYFFPLYIAGVFTHISTLLFTFLYVFIFILLRPWMPAAPFLVGIRKAFTTLKLPSFLIFSRVNLKRTLPLVIFPLILLLSIVAYNFLSSSLLAYLPNLYLDNYQSSFFFPITLLKKFMVIGLVWILPMLFPVKNLSIRQFHLPYFRLLDFNLILSFLFLCLGFFAGPSIFVKLMRISTLIEISSLLFATALVRKPIVVVITFLLFLSTYLSALSRTDYQLFMDNPILPALSFCTF